MFWDWSFFAIAIPAVVFAGVSKGGFGSGAAFASSSILALIMTPGQALGVMLPLLIVMDISTLRPFWKKWDWHSSRLMIMGGVPGVLIGAFVYSVTNDDVIRFLIGAMSVGFVVWQFFRTRVARKSARASLPDWAGVLAGVVAGFTSFVSHAGGPPAAVYMLSLKLSKTQYQANSVVVFWAVNLMKAFAYAFLGIFTVGTLLLDVALAPVAVLGAWIGVKAHHMVPEPVFFGLTYVLLTMTGTKLIFDALT